MNKFRLGLILYFGLISTNGLCQDYGLKPKYSVSFDIEKGSRLLKQCSRGTPNNISSYWIVTADEIKILEDNFKKTKKMKKVSLESSSQIKGGWSWAQHIGCALIGGAVGGGIASTAVYAGCLLTLDNKPFEGWSL
jgi:hypothetical protein